MKTIHSMLLDHFEFYGMQANINQLKMWSNELEGLNLVDLYEAIKKTWSDSSLTKPAMPAKLIELTLGIISPNEAWAKVENICNDESAAIVWSEEMRLSWGDAYPLIRSNDMIAARMTFIESYRKRISQLISEKKRPKHTLSSGTKENNVAALLDAISKKQIEPKIALSYEPELKIPDRILNSLQIEHSERKLLGYQIEQSKDSDNQKVKNLINDFFKQQNEKKEKQRLEREAEKQAEKERIKKVKEEQLQNFKKEIKNEKNS